ncbi:MAG: rod shape-determining protein MreC [Kiritimatiellales bacterium]
MIGRRKILKWIAAALALLLLFNLPATCSSRIKSVFNNSAAPVQMLLLSFGMSLKEGWDAVRGFDGLIERNQRLTEEVIRLQAKAVMLENLAEENRRLHEQLDFSDAQPDNLIAAQVIARSVSGWWQSVRLDKGTKHGVRSNSPVISSDGLVGCTAGVSALSSEVILVSDPACKVSARISRTGSFGIVSGRGTNLKGYPVARMQFIHKDIPVREGDAVVTSGLGGIFPKNILIGYIDKIYTEENGLYQYADIIPKAVVYLMEVVFVSTNNDMAEDGE